MERETVEVYETRGAEWTARRSPGDLERARRLAADIGPGAVRVDLGCGPGWHARELGEPIVAIDAARSMLDLAGERAPGAWLVQADLEALPFRDRSFGGAWAWASYLHVARARLPLALARLHWAMEVDAPLYLAVTHGDGEGLLPTGDFPGRFFAEWRAPELGDVLVGAGFTVEGIDEQRGDRANFLLVRARRARTLPDTVGQGMRMLVCGLNPSVYAADRGVGYARPGNRFWPAALTAGLVSRGRDPLHALTAHGVGMTDLVKRATRSAADLSSAEYRDGAARVGRLVQWFRPSGVCFVGVTGWRAAIDPRAAAGEQPEGFAGVPAYVMPSTSGANAHVRPADLVAHLRSAIAVAAG